MNVTSKPGWRSGTLFLIGVFLAAGLALSLDNAGKVLLRNEVNILSAHEADFLTPLPPRPLTAFDLSAAQRAWQYFELNIRAETGLVDSVTEFPSTTLWDQGSYVFALVAAARLEIISPSEARRRAKQLLQSFRTMPLYDETLPNKAYNTLTLAITDYENTVLETGIGWSALDVARMLMAFRVLEKHFPELSLDIHSVVARWDLRAFANEGELWGTSVDEGTEYIRQEGRLGYEQYGARAAALWGLDVAKAMSAARNLEWVNVSGIQIPADARRASSFQAITPILSEPYLLQAFEIGLDREGQILAHKVFAAQLARYEALGIPTMVSEDHLDEAPSFAYSSVYSNGRAWAVVDEAGNALDHLRTLSTKAVFGWDALYDSDYTEFLVAELKAMPPEGKGWQAGLYETDQSVNDVYSLNTNAVILEAMHFKAFGNFLAR